jgi:archaetidylinositol phosphate synthase
MTEPEPHRRINDILLGPLERPALRWLAAHLPLWVTSDVLTGIGVLGALIIFVSYWLTWVDARFLWVASLGFVVNWFGDSLDGTVARYRKVERPKYGFFVDHTVDAFSEVLVFLGLGLSPYVRFEIACLALIGYLLMSVLVYVRTYVEGVFKISYAGVGPTEMRAIAVAANAVMFFVGNPIVQLPVGSFSVYDLVGATVAIALGGAFVISAATQAARLAKLDE